MKVLLVEDNPGDARLVREMLAEEGGGKFKLTHVGRLSEALTQLKEGGFDILLIDLSLPDSHGLDTFYRLHAQAPAVPIVVSTGSADEEFGIEAVREGAQDYLVKGRLDGKLLIRSLRYAVERNRAAVKRLPKEEKTRVLLQTIQAIALTAEKRDPYTAGHQRRVAELAAAIAQEMVLPREQVDGIHMGGLVHDIGKIHVPAEILNWPSRLDTTQFELIKTHAQVGYEILKGIEFSAPVAQMVLQHHERMNGSGYPQGLSGESIIRGARILAVADVVEAMTSYRPYRPGLSVDKALEETSQNRGVLYDPRVVDACHQIITEKGFDLKAGSPPNTLWQREREG